ncbi:MAG: hypothetical protein D3923_00275 [Candidatus Electrothrix sp. AR3]|nr:hypothetical protein [Candidatus Electrothrix sp. AR3]
MKRSRSLAVVMALFLLAFTVPKAFARFETNKWEEEKAVEKGGWYVTYGKELRDVAVTEGNVEPGVSVYTGKYPGERNRQLLHAWAESLIRKSMARMENSLGTAAVRNFGLEEQKKARKTTLRTVKSLLRNRQTGLSEILGWESIEFKAGVSRYLMSSRNRGVQTETASEVFVPYVALRRRPVSVVVSPHQNAPYTTVVPTPAPIVQYQAVPTPPVSQYGSGQQYSLPNQNPTQQRPVQQRATSIEVLNTLTLNNTARHLRKKNGNGQLKLMVHAVFCGGSIR